MRYADVDPNRKTGADYPAKDIRTKTYGECLYPDEPNEAKPGVKELSAEEMHIEEYEDKPDMAEPYPKDQPVEDEDTRPYKEPDLSWMNLSLLERNLGHCLGMIDDEVMKGYLTKLDQLPVIRMEESYLEDLQDIYFFRISELVYLEDEFSVDKLAMVFHALSGKPCTLVLMLKSDGLQTDFYLGARPKGDYSPGTLLQMLRQTLLGFFPGSRITQYYDEDRKKDMAEEALAEKIGCISGVTCVADYKRNREDVSDKDFIQGLEKFVYAMQGKSYTAVMIADQAGHDQLMARKREYERIYTQISPFTNMQMNFTVSDGGSLSVGKSESYTLSGSHTDTQGSSKTKTDSNTKTTGSNEAIVTSDTQTDIHGESQSTAEGEVHTEGASDGTNRTVSNGVNGGVYFGGKINEIMSGGVNIGVSHSAANGTSHTESVSDSVSRTLTHGFSDSHGKSHGVSQNYGTMESESASQGVGIGTNQSAADTSGVSFNLVNTRTMAQTFGNSQGIVLNEQNMTLKLTLQRLEKHLQRIEECESFGMWSFAAYFLGESAAEAETAAKIYKSVIAGSDSGIERSAIHSWTDEESVEALLPYIRNFMHPVFVYQGFSYEDSRYIAVNPSALVSTNELAIHMGLPRHSVRGLPVVEHAAFAQEVVTRKAKQDKQINLGRIYHLGQQMDTGVNLDLDSLAMHTFITGSTGSGKSNAVYRLLSKVREKRIPFLVVEPAKGEYKDVFRDAACYGTNPKSGELLKINPFSFPEKIHVLEHIDRIVEIFNVCWPMYAAMPAVLKDSIEQAYVSAGWDLDLSENTKAPGLFPAFDDVLRELNATMKRSDYSADTKGDYIGSLSTRLKSLTNGINGRIFVNDEMDLGKLFDQDAIIDISRVGSMETKSLIMGIVVLKLQEYRMAGAAGMNMPLSHLTVLEEAHHLLKKTSTAQNTESSNLAGKSVEMLTNAIAEVRTYGEGFVIVDQAPNLLDTAVIRNTNTKIVLRLPERTDRDVAGGAIALTDKQMNELARLPQGVAAVYQNDWQEAVLCSMPEYKLQSTSLDESLAECQFLSLGESLAERQPPFLDESSAADRAVNPVKARKKQSQELLHYLLKKSLDAGESERAKELIRLSNASAKIRKDLIVNLDKRNMLYEWAVADFINKNFEFGDVFRGTSGCADLKQLSSIMRQNIEEEFADFTRTELYAVMYYICRIEHEKHPDNAAIELLRTKYLRERML